MTGGEAVYQSLRMLVDGWDHLPVRTYQDGAWRNLLLSEIKDEQEVASQVLRFISARHVRTEPEEAMDMEEPGS